MNYFSEIFLTKMHIIRIHTNLAPAAKKIMINVLKLVVHTTVLMTKLALLILSVLLFILKDIFAQERNSFGLMSENYINGILFIYLFIGYEY